MKPMPLQGAQVTLEVNGPVYAGVTPAKTEQLLTNSTVGFVIMHISHKRGVKYTITARKNGFATTDCFGKRSPRRTPHDSPEED